MKLSESLMCLSPHLVRNPRSVCEFVSVCDSDDNRRLQEERVTALRRESDNS